jgi:hypothetical protein
MVHTKSRQMTDTFDRLIRFSFYALIFFLPISIALVETFSGFAIFFFLIKRIVILRQKKFEIFRPVPSFLNRPLAIFVLATFLSVIFSQHHQLSIVAFFGKTLQGVLLFIVFLEVFNEVKFINNFLLFWASSALLTCLSGFSQYLFHFEFLRGNEMSEGRVSSSLRHANDLGAYIITVCPILFVLLLNWKFFKQQLLKQYDQLKLSSTIIRIFLWTVCLVMMVTLGLTMSRAAWVAFFAAIVLSTIYRKKNIFFVFLMVMGFVVIFMPLMVKTRDVSLITDNVREQRNAFAKVGYIIQSDLGHIGPHSDKLYKDLIQNAYINEKGIVLDKFWKVKDASYLESNLDLTAAQKQAIYDVLKRSNYWQTILAFTVERLGKGRLDYWKEALGVLYDYPVFGSGLNTYSQVAPHYKITWGGYPHNSYLQTAAELGLVGLFALLWMLGSLFKNSFRRINNMPEGFPRSVLIGTLAGYFAYLVHSFFDTTFYSVQLSTFFWLMMALAVAVGRVDKSPSPAKIHQ